MSSRVSHHAQLTADEGYKPFLSLPGEEDPTELEASGMPDQAKVALLVESRGEIVHAERDLREIELLRERGVEGSGALERESSGPRSCRSGALTDAQRCWTCVRR